MIKDQLSTLLEEAARKLKIEEEINLTHPANPNHGDYATSIALKTAKTLKKNPLELAQEIKDSIQASDLIEKIEVLKPGFINFFISPKVLVEQTSTIAGNDYYGHSKQNKKKFIVEFAHPNTHKLFHIGHLLNISIGESLSRIFASQGVEIIRANYQGDVGMHIAKCLWRLHQMKENNEMKKIFQSNNITAKIKLLGKAYAEGNKAYEEDEKAKKEIIEINGQIYRSDSRIYTLWEETRLWSLEYFEKIYERVGTHFDRLFFEHEMADRGVEVVKEAQKKGILSESEGAIIFDGAPHGLDKRVFLNSLGYPTYEGKELALAEMEFSEFGQIDKCIHIVGPEQSSFFKVTFKVEELLDQKKYKDKQYHLAYGWVRLKEGKMSSRKGTVIEGMQLLDDVKLQIHSKFNSPNETAEKLAVAAVKYSFLKSDIRQDVVFDLKESVSIDGNSGPYILYTYVRAKNVLSKEPKQSFNVSQIADMNDDEKALLRTLYQFPEIVEKASETLSPHLISVYLYDLSKLFSIFYTNSPILKSEGTIKNLRLLLTASVAQVLKNGLTLLGIETVEKM